MREIRQSGSEGGARFNPSFLPLSLFRPQKLAATEMPFLFREQPRTIRMESRLQAVRTG